MSGFLLPAPGRFALLLALVVSLSAAAAACSDDEGDTPTPTATVVAIPTQAATAAATPTPTATAAATPTQAATAAATPTQAATAAATPTPTATAAATPTQAATAAATPTQAATAAATPTQAATAAATPTQAATAAATPTQAVEGEQLKIGYLADFSGPLAEYGADIETGVQLAIKHINEAGGVNGQDVIYVTGDTRVDPTQSVEEARRLVDIEGVHAIVGPLSSTATLAVADSVTAPGRIPHISPSATSPAITAADDDGFLFRTTGSDVVQGVVLAQLVESEGHTNVGVIFRDDAWGQGLSEVFSANFSGTATLASYAADGQLTYLAELRQATSGGAEVLVAMGFAETEVFLRESIENGIFTRFIFTDGNKSEDLIEQLGAEHLEGTVGTAPSSNPDNASTKAWDAAYMAEYGRLPSLPFVREAYDAVIAIAIAAEAAGSTDGVAIRDELARIAGPPGDTYGADAAGVKAALEAVRNGDDINFEGAATPIDWNEAGDVTSGFMEIYGYRDGQLITLEIKPFSLE